MFFDHQIDDINNVCVSQHLPERIVYIWFQHIVLNSYIVFTHFYFIDETGYFLVIVVMICSRKQKYFILM